ncbi:MAG: SDR family oxidoreductase [Spirochaetaceae bacterium]|nr:MAG: SDR family oxidoreductase [Spirochaetaceae bacterium]
MTYLVVGGSSGIGKAVVERLLADGHAVTVWARREKPSYESGDPEYAQVDVTEDLPDDLPVPDALDGVFYAPGNIQLAPFRGLKAEAFAHDYNVNVLGAVRVLQAVLPRIADGHGASVVLVSTVAATTGMNFHTSIAAAKAGVEGLARSLAAELAPKNVRVNVIAPSLTDTPLAAKLLDNDKKRERSAERHPLKRVGTVDDMAEAVTYLLTPRSGWVTAQVLGVDGGMSRISGL